MRRRKAFTLFQLLLVLAVLGVVVALLLPALVRARDLDARQVSSNNLQQLALSLHNYAHSNRHLLPTGRDANGFSTLTYLLPYVEQDNVYQKIDLKKPFDDPANADARKALVQAFLSPRDPVRSVQDGWGATNYVCNDLVFPAKLHTAFPRSFADGLSNTVVFVETLKGDGGIKAVTVQRQIVLLDKDALKDLKEDAGVKYFKDNKHISGHRCASWTDGRFLQTRLNGRLRPNDGRPDVSCAGEGGVSAVRMDGVIPVGLADGSARNINPRISHKTWQAAFTPAGGEVLGTDW
jgi:type II secretory pathway pseudopilin PulG